MTVTWEIRCGDALERLREMPDASVHCCVTSPPYYGLRDYGDERQIGLESTADEYVARLVEVFREVRRVLRDHGTLWLNLGDSYAGSWGAQGHREVDATISRNQIRNHPKRASGTGTIREAGMKPKDLMGTPWAVAFALRADGWYLRSDIVWAKTNPMPESVTDRPTRAHEYVFLLSKRARYFYDAEAVRESDAGADHPRTILHRPEPSGGLRSPYSGIRCAEGRNGAGRSKRSVWWVATEPFAGAHFAVFPPKLIEPCVVAGSSPVTCGQCGAPWKRVVERKSMVVREGPGRATAMSASTGSSSRTQVTGTMLAPPVARTVGWEPTCSHRDGSGSSVVLDPFAGSGTTGLVATRHGRSFIGIELNATYVELARRRIIDDEPLIRLSQEAA